MAQRWNSLKNQYHDIAPAVEELAALPHCRGPPFRNLASPKFRKRRKEKVKKPWKAEARNYRRVKNEKGEIIANIITVDGVDVEVTEEIYLAYSQPERRERYLSEEAANGQCLSLEHLEEMNVLPIYLGMATACSAEDDLIAQANSLEADALSYALWSAVKKLKPEDQKLLKALYFEKVSAREYARRTGVSDMAIRKRHKRVLKKLKENLENGVRT